MESFEGSAVVEYPQRWRRAGTVLVAAAAAVVIAAACLVLQGTALAEALLVHLLVLAAGLVAFTRTRVGLQRGASARITLARHHVAIAPSVGAARRIDRDDVASALSVCDGAVQAARITLRSGAVVTIVAPTAALQGRLLETLGADLRTVAVPLSGVTATSRTLAAIGTALVVVLAEVITGVTVLGVRHYGNAAEAALGVACGLTLGGLTAVWLARRLFGSVVVVGADGVVVRRALRQAVFIPYAELKHLSHYIAGHGRGGGGELWFVRTHGAPIDVRVTNDHDGYALSARVRQAVVAVAASAASDLDARLLERRGRELGVWTAELRAMLTRPANYRQQVVTTEQFLAVCENPGERPELRVAAAVALGASGDTQAACRVRAAAEACAHPRLRAALEAAVSADADAHALDELSRDAG